MNVARNLMVTIGMVLGASLTSAFGAGSAQDPLAQPRSSRQAGLPPQVLRSAIPRDEPVTSQRVKLGQLLFFESALSVDHSVSCATCHDPNLAFTDGRPVAIGVHGRQGQRNAPTIFNALFNKAQFWDGRAPTLEAQARNPLVNPSEMGQPSVAAAAQAIAGEQRYRDAFHAAFGHDVNADDLVRAIAAYERTLVSFDAPFDRYVVGESSAISDSAKRGWQLFNTKARCNKCHAPDERRRDTVYFTDFDYHNIGIGILHHHVAEASRTAEAERRAGTLGDVDRVAIESPELSVLGRFLITWKEKDSAAFKTPGLRNVLVTAPYFHDGSQATLWDVIDHYNKGAGLQNPWLDEDIQPLALTEPEIDDLVAFLASLTSAPYREIGERELARQRAIAQTSRPQRDTTRAFGPKPPRPKLPESPTK